MSVCVISCIFGNKFRSVYNSVKNYDTYFFSNNPNIKEIVENAGWKYIYIDFLLSDDDAISSFQSKYIKFLQYLKDNEFNYFNKYEKIIYTDHKLELKDYHIEYLLSILDNKEILVIEHFQRRKNIWIEVGEAMFQERYLRFMNKTIDYINHKINEGYSENCIIILTGLIIYNHHESKTIKFTDKIYSDLKMIGTSQCQIIWSLIGQKYTDIIKIIQWDVLKIMPKEPKNEKEDIQNKKLDALQFLTSSVDYVKKELRNKTAHLDQLKKSIDFLKTELQIKKNKIELLAEKENHMENEIENKKKHIEKLILSERKLKHYKLSIINSKSWKIASKIFGLIKKVSGRN